MKESLLELKDISRYFRDDFSLKNINLSLKKGEVHILAGENGSGKTVLMKIIAGILQPDHGTIFFQDREDKFSSLHESAKAGICYIPQDPQLFENMSIAENIYFSWLPRRHFFRQEMDIYRLHSECLKLFNRYHISLDPEMPVVNLGYAERLLVGALKASTSDAKVFIFDEPTAGMNEPESKILFQILQELKLNNAGIFYITHKLDEIKQIGTRVSIIQHGRIIGTLNGQEAERDQLVHMMTGHVTPERYPRLKVKPGPVVLSVEKLTSNPVLKDVSFSLHKGEILGITGLMGSGRTRLANCLSGQLRPSSGVVKVNGREVQFRHPAEALTEGIALIPEDRSINGIFPFQDIQTNLTAAALPRFLDGPALDICYMQELTKNYVHNLSIIPEKSQAPLWTYSGGNQQKVVVGRWLMSMANIYIMDEPTRGVDASARVDIYNAMNDLVTKGAAVLLLSSDVDEILGMSDRIFILAKGRFRHSFGCHEATKEKIIDFLSED